MKKLILLVAFALAACHPEPNTPGLPGQPGQPGQPGPGPSPGPKPSACADLPAVTGSYAEFSVAFAHYSEKCELTEAEVEQAIDTL